ncbi:MAG: hypothetical protein JWQ35_2532 [Bacteriovoracaceae bacterium]|nr:hypothetical protein [Bacteriovoracaceae bacterium]
MIYQLLFRAAQMLLGVWVQKKNVTSLNQLAEKSAVTYAEGVKALRSAAILSFVFFSLAIFLCAAIFLVIHGFITLQPIPPEKLAWVEILSGGILVLLSLIGVVFLCSESLWVKTFKIDKLVGNISATEAELIQTSTPRGGFGWVEH